MDVGGIADTCLYVERKSEKRNPDKKLNKAEMRKKLQALRGGKTSPQQIAEARHRFRAIT